MPDNTLLISAISDFSFWWLVLCIFCISLIIVIFSAFIFTFSSSFTNPASGGATWTGWKEFINGTFTGRGFDFKTILTSNNTDENILVDELGYKDTLQRRQEQSTGAIASGAGSKTVNFAKNFFTGTSGLGGANAYLPSIGINAMNLASGDYIEMGTVTGSSFVVTFKNSSNAAVDRNFTWSAVGYGKTV